MLTLEECKKYREATKHLYPIKGKKDIIKYLKWCKDEIDEQIEAVENDRIVTNKAVLKELLSMPDDLFKLSYEQQFHNGYGCEGSDVQFIQMGLFAHLDIPIELHMEAKKRYNEVRDDRKK